MNCPNCGAVIKEGKFCNYCGAKLPDDTKRVEVNVNKRIEDVAEMKRADYETAESKFRQQQMREALLGKRIRRWVILILLVICVACAIIVTTGMLNSSNQLLGVLIMIIIGTGGVFLLGYAIYLLVTGKW